MSEGPATVFRICSPFLSLGVSKTCNSLPSFLEKKACNFFPERTGGSLKMFWRVPKISVAELSLLKLRFLGNYDNSQCLYIKTEIAPIFSRGANITGPHVREQSFQSAGVQGSALRKIEQSPVLWAYKIQGCPACHFCGKNLDFLVAQEQKLGSRGHQVLLEHNLP